MNDPTNKMDPTTTTTTTLMEHSSSGSRKRTLAESSTDNTGVVGTAPPTETTTPPTGGGAAVVNPLYKEEEEDDDDDETTHPTYQRMMFYGEHRRAVSSVCVAPSRLCKNKQSHNNYIVASAGADGLCKIWDLANPITSRTGTGARRAVQNCSICVGHARGINDVSWNNVAPLLATASDDKTCRIWDAVTAETLVELKGHDNFVFCVDQHHHMVATGSFDECVKLWDIRTGDCFTTLPAHSDPVTAVSFNRDGTTLCTASHDGLVRIWDTGTAECLKTIFAAGNPSVSSVQYSANGKYILAGTLDSTVRLWPVALNGTNTCAKTYREPSLYKNTKYSVVADFTSTGDILVGNETGQCVLFDVQTGQVRQVLDPHEDAVLAVSAHDTQPFLCTGGMTNDRKVEFWSTDGIAANPMNRTTSTTNTSNNNTSNNNHNGAKQSAAAKQRGRDKKHNDTVG